MEEITAKKASSNVVWRLLERFGAQGVAFIVSIVLARLLDPVVYGTVALVTAFTSILQVFIDGGFGNALIQKKDADDTDFSTVFYFNVVFCLVIYAGMFFLAPVIADFYGNSELTAIVRVLSLTIVISGVKNVQQAYVQRNMLFRKFFWSTLGGTIGAAVIGIYMAYKGYGVWALVVQSLFNNTVDTLILWITVKWKPKWKFSWSRLKGLFSYGWKILVSKLVESLYTQSRSLVIGKLYTSDDLAFYNKGNQFPNLIVTNVDNSIESVLFPTIASAQDDKKRVKAIVKRVVKTSSYLIMPMMMGLAVCAEPLIRLILTEKWVPCIPYLRIFCFTFAFVVFNTANMNCYRSIGRSDIYLYVEIARKVVGFVCILASMWFGVMWIAIAEVIYTIIAMVIASAPNKKLINYGFWEQLKDVLPILVITCIMGACVYPITLLGLPDIVTLCIQVPLGIIIYICLSVLFKMESFKYLIGLAKEFMQKHKGKNTNEKLN